MAGRSRLCSGPEEILFYIVENLRGPGPSRVWPDGQTIRFANNQVLHLSQVNHLFRRLCLPLLYEHIIIRSTEANLFKLPFDLFRRTMERKPHLADLVRGIEVVDDYSDGSDTSHVFDSLPFLPKIKRIDFGTDIKLDLDLLFLINSHPSLLTVHLENATTNAFSFPNPLSLQHGALSRVLVNNEDIFGDSHLIELLWLYFTKLGLRVKILTITETTPPLFLSLTYPDLREIYIDVAPAFSSDGPEPLGWFPSFLKRHPQLEIFWIGLDQYEEGHLAWEALKNVPIIRPLIDASHSRGLISSFSFRLIAIGIERFSSSWVVIDVNLPQDLLEIIHLLGSLLPIPEVTLHCHRPIPHILPINVTDFVSAFQENYKTLSWLTLCAVRQVLDLDSLSTDEELHFYNTVTGARLRHRTKQLAQLTRMLHAGLPRLTQVDFDERSLGRIDDELGREWRFSVSGDGRVQLDRLC